MCVRHRRTDSAQVLLASSVRAEVGQTWSFRGSKSRNKVSVGEPAEGSLTIERMYGGTIHCSTRQPTDECTYCSFSQSVSGVHRYIQQHNNTL